MKNYTYLFTPKRYRPTLSEFDRHFGKIPAHLAFGKVRRDYIKNLFIQNPNKELLVNQEQSIYCDSIEECFVKIRELTGELPDSVLS